MASFYHYTSIDTLYSMLGNSIVEEKETGNSYLSLWATHINFLNDETERELYVNKLLSDVTNYFTCKNEYPTPQQIEYIKQLCINNIYVISLSSEKLNDDLSMWRGYGANGYGVCIEFDFSKIAPFSWNKDTNMYQTENVYAPQKCIYCKPEEIEIDNDLLEKIYNHLTNNSNVNGLDYTMNEASIITQIMNKIAIYKHEAYIVEDEYRIINHSYGKPKFNKVGNVIKPYMVYPIPVTAISSITIGPCNKNSDIVKGLVRFIKTKLGNNFVIKYSNIPYRG